MKSQEIRKIWVEFFEKKKKHLHIPSASLVPQNPTLLLTNAGMVPFVPYFLGQEKPPSSRAVSIQKCVRVGGKDSDLENIGKTPRHLTFFEMLGNFSFGDYFKEEVIPWSWELLTQGYGFKSEQLIVSIFEGDEKVGEDTEAFNIWYKKVGVPKERIWKLGRADNFWGPPGGISGPCGPCSEIYYDPGDGSEPIEIWNLVFMQYEQFEDGSLKPLPKPNVDTGAGLERIATILQNKETVFETDLLSPIIDGIKKLDIDKSNPKLDLALKIIADHTRCSAMLISDGVKPSNLGRGYVLRMLIRRAARFGWLIGLKKPFLSQLISPVQEIFGKTYPQVQENKKQIEEIIETEEKAFAKTLENGLKEFNNVIENTKDKKINGEKAFDLYATFGFPVELTTDLAEERGLTVDLEGYEKAKQAHSEVSNQGKFAVGLKNEYDDELKKLADTEFIGYEKCESEVKILFSTADFVVLDKTPFYAESGGQLADTGEIKSESGVTFKVKDVQKYGKVFLHKGYFINKEGLPCQGEMSAGQRGFATIDEERRKEIRKHHTATHLLQSALRQVLGEDVQQAGSQVDSNRLRFDFTAPKPPSKKQITEIEDLINVWVKQSLTAETKVMSYDDAIKSGALAFFGDKYEDDVRVLSIGDDSPVSVELCGGTHVTNTVEIGSVKIISESAISAGTRRIEMLVGESFIEHVSQKAQIIDELAINLKVPAEEVGNRVNELQQQIQANQKQLKALEKELVQFKANELLNKVEEKDGIKKLSTETDLTNLREALDFIGSKLQENYVLFLYSKAGPKLSYAAKVSKELTTSPPVMGAGGVYSAKDIVAKFAEQVGGSGGGRPEFAQGGGGDLEKSN